MRYAVATVCIPMGITASPWPRATAVIDYVVSLDQIPYARQACVWPRPRRLRLTFKGVVITIGRPNFFNGVYISLVVDEEKQTLRSYYRSRSCLRDSFSGVKL